MTATPPPFSRRWFLGAMAASGAALPAQAEAPRRSPTPPLRPGAERPVPTAAELVAGADLGGRVGYMVADGRSGAVLDSRNAGTAMPCASITKIFTTLYALDRLGPDHRFATHLVATGPVVGGRIQGDLILLGGGDPTLDADDMAEMATALAAQGVRGVTGRFLYDASLIPHFNAMDPSQPPQAGYNPGLSGLNLNFNRVHFQWRRTQKGFQTTMDARGERVQPAVRDITIRIVNRALPLYTYREGKATEAWTVAAQALGRRGSRWLPVRRPAPYAADVFRTLAAAQGIRLPAPAPGRTPAGSRALVTHQSDPLTEVLREMLKYSTNLTAELVGLAASATADGTAPSSLARSGAEMQAWVKARFGVSPHFADHSGLAPGTRVSAAELVRVLALAAPDGQLRALLKTIPMRDARGRRLADSPLSVQAKTGTLNFVSGLAGYASGPDGRELIFAILTEAPRRRNAARNSPREHPPGVRVWIRHSRRLQQQLVQAWAARPTRG